VVLAFEDLHSADEGLLDFVEHLLTWSAEHPISSAAALDPMFLEPLDERAVHELLSGLVAGQPRSVGCRWLRAAPSAQDVLDEPRTDLIMRAPVLAT
jgi:hypothetical protein